LLFIAIKTVATQLGQAFSNSTSCTERSFAPRSATLAATSVRGCRSSCADAHGDARAKRGVSLQGRSMCASERAGGARRAAWSWRIALVRWRHGDGRPCGVGRPGGAGRRGPARCSARRGAPSG
jgi:hypothetical protein